MIKHRERKPFGMDYYQETWKEKQKAKINQQTILKIAEK